MKTEVIWNQYQDYTNNLTEHSRKLAFAGAAICWFFKTPDVTFPPMIYWSLALFVGYFIADVLHYMSGAIMLRWFVQKAEFKLYQETGSIVGDIDKPRWIDWPATTFFLIKCFLLMGAFGFIVAEIYGRLDS